MGRMILQQVLQCLRQAEIPAEESCPGRKYPQISQPVAAVHIHSANTQLREVVLEVCVVCPGSMGAGACAAEGMRVCRLLQKLGASCQQNGYRYDGMSRLTQVSILATFEGWETENHWISGPGFRVLADGEELPWVVNFQAEQVVQAQPRYVMGEALAADIAQGSVLWKLQLEQKIPNGCAEDGDIPNPDRLMVEREGISTCYTGCCWTEISRLYSREGLVRRFTGICTGREKI